MNHINDHLASLSSKSKRYIIYTLALLFVMFNFIAIYKIEQHLNKQSLMMKQQQLALHKNYTEHLQNFTANYTETRQQYEQFNFYENYHQLVAPDRQINQQYKQSVDNFTDISQTQYYKFYEIVQSIAVSKKYSEIAKIVYDYSDWSSKRVKVKNDKGFNATHIFSVLASIQYWINGQGVNNSVYKKTDEWISLSAQEIIDCCEQCIQYMNPKPVYQYIKQFGVTVQSAYPYESSRFNRSKKQCRRDKYPDAPRYNISKYHSVKNCEKLSSLLMLGPVVVGIDGRDLELYDYGLYDDCTRKITHYALAVAFEYNGWKLQNSWGRKWGERGYIRLNSRNTCGLCLDGSVPVFYV